MAGLVITMGTAEETVPQTVGQASKQALRRCGARLFGGWRFMRVGCEKLFRVDSHGASITADEALQVKFPRNDVKGSGFDGLEISQTDLGLMLHRLERNALSLPCFFQLPPYLLFHPWSSLLQFEVMKRHFPPYFDRFLVSPIVTQTPSRYDAVGEKCSVGPKVSGTNALQALHPSARREAFPPWPRTPTRKTATTRDHTANGR